MLLLFNNADTSLKNWNAANTHSIANTSKFIEIFAMKTKLKYQLLWNKVWKFHVYSDIFVFKASKKSIAGWMAVRVCITKV